MVRVLEILTGVYREILPICEKQGLKLDFDVGDLGLEVEDGAEIRRILLALLRAAIRRTQEGTIGIGAVRLKSGVRVIVKDTGELMHKTEWIGLEKAGMQVRSRFGYGSVVSFKITIDDTNKLMLR